MGVVNFDKAGDIGVTLRPKRFDIEVYRGDSFKFYLHLLGPEVIVEGEPVKPPIDVTGWTGRCEVKDDEDIVVDTPTVTIVDGDGETTTNGIFGRFVIDFEVTADIPVGEYKYDVEMTDAGGNVRTFIGGKFTVTVDVTD